MRSPRSTVTRAIPVALAAVAGLGLVTPPASAAAAVPFTLTSTVDFANGVFAFTATGPLCASGTFEDEVVKAAGFQSNRLVVLEIDSVYTCDDGSGSFSVHKHLSFGYALAGQPSWGPMTITGGTGAHEGLAGHGYDVGSRPVDPDHGGGITTGVVVHP